MNQIGNFYIKQALTVVLKQDVTKAGKGWGVGGHFGGGGGGRGGGAISSRPPPPLLVPP